MERFDGCWRFFMELYANKEPLIISSRENHAYLLCCWYSRINNMRSNQLNRSSRNEILSYICMIPGRMFFSQPKPDITVHAGHRREQERWHTSSDWSELIRSRKSWKHSLTFSTRQLLRVKMREWRKHREHPSANPIPQREFLNRVQFMPCGDTLTTNNYFHPAKSFFKMCSWYVPTGRIALDDTSTTE